MIGLNFLGFFVYNTDPFGNEGFPKVHSWIPHLLPLPGDILNALCSLWVAQYYTSQL